MVKARAFIFEKQFIGFPKEGDLKIVEEELPPIKNGGETLKSDMKIFS